MSFDPQKFFIGLMDFFSILLPGALLTYLLMDEVGPVVLGCDRYQELTDGKGVAAFLVASYLVGHLIFLLGSWLDFPYDWLRRRSLNKQIIRLAHRGTLSPWCVRALSWIVFKQEQNFAVNCAGKIKEQMLKPLQAKEAVNTFQWSKAFLAKGHPESLTTVQRFEADFKVFRCFTIVLLALLSTWPLHQKWPSAGIRVILVLLLLAMWRYMDRRYKATNQAHWSVITLTGNQGKVCFDKASPDASSASCADGVVFKKEEITVSGVFDLLRGLRDEVYLIGQVQHSLTKGKAAISWRSRKLIRTK